MHSHSFSIIFETLLNWLLGIFNPILHELFVVKTIFLFLRQSVKVFSNTNYISCNIKQYFIYNSFHFKWLLYQRFAALTTYNFSICSLYYSWIWKPQITGENCIFTIFFAHNSRFGIYSWPFIRTLPHK